MGTYMFSTAEPGNIIAMLTNIAVFELSPPETQYSVLFSAMESSLPTAKNGKLLEHFSTSISSEAKVRVLDTFKMYISKLISMIPSDRSTVDLQKLFLMLTLDTATEFPSGTAPIHLIQVAKRVSCSLKPLPTPRQRQNCNAESAALQLYLLTRNNESSTFIYKFFGYVQRAVEPHKPASKD
jgi:hypothetical protein